MSHLKVWNVSSEERKDPRGLSIAASSMTPPGACFSPSPHHSASPSGRAVAVPPSSPKNPHSTPLPPLLSLVSLQSLLLHGGRGNASVALGFRELICIIWNIPIPTRRNNMTTAKVFMTGRSQANRIPKTFRFGCAEVLVPDAATRCCCRRPRTRLECCQYQFPMANGRYLRQRRRIPFRELRELCVKHYSSPPRLRASA